MLEEQGLTPAQLDDEIPDPFALEEAPDTVAEAAALLEPWPVFGTYVDGETGEPLGAVTYTDGPSPGNDTREVSVSSPLALACLQRRLDDLGANICVVVGRAELG